MQYLVVTCWRTMEGNDEFSNTDTPGQRVVERLSDYEIPEEQREIST